MPYYRRALVYVDRVTGDRRDFLFLWFPAWRWFAEEETARLTGRTYLRYSSKAINDAVEEGRRPVPSVYRIGYLNEKIHERRFVNEGNAWRTAVGRKARRAHRSADRVDSRRAVVHANTIARQRGRIEDLGLDRYDWHQPHRPMSHYRWYWD
jgi:hypothetical protein